MVSDKDKALCDVGNASTLVNCVGTMLIQSDQLPNGVMLGDIGSALAMLAEILDEAFGILQG